MGDRACNYYPPCPHMHPLSLQVSGPEEQKFECRSVGCAAHTPHIYMCKLTHTPRPPHTPKMLIWDLRIAEYNGRRAGLVITDLSPAPYWAPGTTQTGLAAGPQACPPIPGLHHLLHPMPGTCFFLSFAPEHFSFLQGSDDKQPPSHFHSSFASVSSAEKLD